MRCGSSSTFISSAGLNYAPEEYCAERQRLQRSLAAQLRAAMATLVGNIENADIMLVSADGKKVPAHECILRARAPGFYQRHVEATIAAMEKQRMEPGQLREVAIGDIDSAGLEFFIHSVYTEDEIAMFPSTVEGAEERLCDECHRRFHKKPTTSPCLPKATSLTKIASAKIIYGDSGSRNSQRSFQMDEDSQTDMEEFRSDMEDSTHRDNDPAPQGDRTPSGDATNMAVTMSMSSNGQTNMAPSPMFASQGAEDQRQMLSRQSSAPVYAVPTPTMTSFRDLATGSPMNSSIYSLGGRSEIGPDIPEEEEEGSSTDRRDSSRTEVSMSKFIRLDSVNDTARSTPVMSPTKRQKAIFPMFIGLGEGDDQDAVPQGIRGRAMMAKRLSVASLTSLTSIDVMTSSEVHLDAPEKHPSCTLAADLLRMYLDNIDTDVVIRTENGELFAHKCILSAMSPFFRQQLKKSPKLEMKGYTKNTVHFLMSFLYGGVTAIPDEVDIWEVVSLATHLNLKHLVDVIILHLKMTRCHLFHRPCSGCVSAAFDILPQLQTIRCMRPLYDEVMQWVARHFARIWKSRVFLHAHEKWHKECFDAVIAYMDDETVIDIILGCERLQTCLPRVRSDTSTVVAGYVNEVLDMSLQFLTHSFHLIVTSRSFAAQGKGLALNVNLLEELLPPLVHSLSADVAIKSFIGLTEIRDAIRDSAPRQDDRGFPVDDCSPRFAALIHRLRDLVDKHLLHFAASVVRADSYALLPPEEQQRIQDTGLFVEMRQPKATPPRLSSFYRTYKRSASAGVQPGPMSGPMFDMRKRTQSVERPEPSSPQLVRRDHSDTSMDETTPPSRPSSVPRAAQAPPPTVVETPPPAVEATPPPTAAPPPSTSRGSSPRAEKREEKPDAPRESVSKEAKKTKRDDAPSATTATTATTSTPAPPAREPVSRKASEGRRSPVKATKSRVIETEEGGRFERQQTHTIITTGEAAKAAAALLPGPSPKKVPEKPKSVVKPMPQESLAKERTLPRVGPGAASGAGASLTASVTSRLSQPKEASKVRSAIPRKAATPSASSTATKASDASAASSRRRQPEASASTSRAPRSPKNARKAMPN